MADLLVVEVSELKDERQSAAHVTTSRWLVRGFTATSLTAALAVAVLLALIGLFLEGSGHRAVAAGALVVAIIAGWQLFTHRYQPGILVVFIGVQAVVLYRAVVPQDLLVAALIVLSVLSALAASYVPGSLRRSYLLVLGGLWVIQLIPDPVTGPDLRWLDIGERVAIGGLQLALFVATVTVARTVGGLMSRADRRYRELYERVPISIWDEDFSEVARWLTELRATGVVDLRSHLEQHPSLVDDASALIKVRSVNPATVTMLEAASSEQLTGRIDPRTNTGATRRSYTDQLVAIWEGRDSTSTEVAGLTMGGRHFDGILHWSVPRGPGGDLQLGEVVVAIDDVTELKAAQGDLASTNALLNAIADSQRQFISHVGADDVFGDLLGKVVELTGVEFALLATSDPHGVEAASAAGWDEGTRSLVIGRARRRVGVDLLLAIADRLETRHGTAMATRFDLQIARAHGADVPDALTSLLSLSLRHGNELLGRIVLGNRPGGFEGRLAESLSPLVANCAALVAAYRAEELRRGAENALRANDEQLRTGRPRR